MSALGLASQALEIVAALAWYLTVGRQMGLENTQLSAYTFGTYPYSCDNGTSFAMSPANDMSTLLLEFAATEAFTLSKVNSVSGVRYEGGEGMLFEAHGETVILTMGGTTVTCIPVQNQDEAPFNFGD